MTAKDLQKALPRFDEFVDRFGTLLGEESRPARAKAYLRGLLLDADDNKNAETIALNAHGGDTSQVRMTQFFISQATWPDGPLRTELVGWVNDDLGSDDGVLIVDESGFPKCGTKSVGVARQYCGATGKIDNCQVAVYLAYAAPQGHTLLDTRLYLPADWTEDPERCREAGVPDQVVFRTKPELALELVQGRGRNIRHGWVTFDEGYGKDPAFLSGLEESGERYLGEVPKSVRGWLQRPVVEPAGSKVKGRGRPLAKPRVRPDQPKPQTVEAIAATLPATAWQRIAYREGTKGVQHAHFARVRLFVERDDLPGPELWLMIERGCAQEPYVKYYLSNAQPTCSLPTMARVGHTRWPVEDCFLQGKQELGLDAYEVRGWRGWHHHMTLVMLAMWFLKLETRRLGEKSYRRYHAA
jgi:SRSO17 transposase